MCYNAATATSCGHTYPPQPPTGIEMYYPSHIATLRARHSSDTSSGKPLPPPALWRHRPAILQFLTSHITASTQLSQALSHSSTGRLRGRSLSRHSSGCNLNHTAVRASGLQGPHLAPTWIRTCGCRKGRTAAAYFSPQSSCRLNGKSAGVCRVNLSSTTRLSDSPIRNLRAQALGPSASQWHQQ